jgi:hypothetical protein
MDRVRGVGKLAAIVSALGLGGTYVAIAATGIVLTGLLLLPATKSSRGIVSPQQVHDFRESLTNRSSREAEVKTGTEAVAAPPEDNAGKANKKSNVEANTAYADSPKEREATSSK